MSSLFTASGSEPVSEDMQSFKPELVWCLCVGN